MSVFTRRIGAPFRHFTLIRNSPFPNPQSTTERIANGIWLLDADGPADWRDRIDPTLLDLNSATECVLGQVFGHGMDKLAYFDGVWDLLDMVPRAPLQFDHAQRKVIAHFGFDVPPVDDIGAGSHLVLTSLWKFWYDNDRPLYTLPIRNADGSRNLGPPVPPRPSTRKMA